MAIFRLLSILCAASTLALAGCGSSTTEKAASEARERLQSVDSSTQYLSQKYDIDILPDDSNSGSLKATVDYPWSSRTETEVSEIESRLGMLIVDVKRLNEIGDRDDIALANREDIRTVGATAEQYLKSLAKFRSGGKSVELDETENPPLQIRIK